MMPGRAGMAVAAIAAAAGAACTARDTVATSAATDEGREQYCDGSGPSVLVDGTCTGQLAANLFRHAVCGCGGLNFDHDLTTDGFDSTYQQPFEPGGEGGEVASNVSVRGNSGMSIGGTLTVSGGEGVDAGEVLEVKGDLRLGGQLGRPGSAIEVTGNASVAGPVMVGTLTLDEGDGTLTTPSASAVMGEVTGHVVESPVSIPTPCICDGAAEVTAAVGDHAVANHDAEISIGPDRLVNVDGDDRLDLPCGRFYLDEISGTTAGKTVVIAAGGRTSLFIGDNITLKQNLTIELEPDAELDVFVGGFIQVEGVAILGDRARPRALRIHVASSGSINLSPGSALSGNLYAPLSDLNSTGPLEVYGAVVVNHINGADTVTVHHDLAITAAGEDCE
jgi:hypothetical protein